VVSTNAMRHPTDKCILCEDKESSQKKSHIIPKFFGTGIFENATPRKGIAWFKNGKTKKVQDIIKEDYLFCPECEKCFSILETYCSLRLERYNSIRYKSNYYRINEGVYEYIESRDIDIKVFNLFIYSIVWRASISNNFGFAKFKLNSEDEEKLRQVLKEFSSVSQSELFLKLMDLKILPNHNHIVFRPEKKLRPPQSMLSAASISEWYHQIHLVDYVLIYLTDGQKLVDRLKKLDNNRLDGFVRIGIIERLAWRNFNFDMLREAME
jgi:hypothetical protein